MLGARASATVAAETGTLPAFPNEFHSTEALRKLRPVTDRTLLVWAPNECHPPLGLLYAPANPARVNEVPNECHSEVPLPEFRTDAHEPKRAPNAGAMPLVLLVRLCK